MDDGVLAERAPTGDCNKVVIIRYGDTTTLQHCNTGTLENETLSRAGHGGRPLA